MGGVGSAATPQGSVGIDKSVVGLSGAGTIMVVDTSTSGGEVRNTATATADQATPTPARPGPSR